MKIQDEGKGMKALNVQVCVIPAGETASAFQRQSCKLRERLVLQVQYKYISIMNTEHILYLVTHLFVSYQKIILKFNLFLYLHTYFDLGNI